MSVITVVVWKGPYIAWTFPNADDKACNNAKSQISKKYSIQDPSRYASYLGRFQLSVASAIMPPATKTWRTNVSMGTYFHRQTFCFFSAFGVQVSWLVRFGGLVAVMCNVCEGVICGWGVGVGRGLDGWQCDVILIVNLTLLLSPSAIFIVMQWMMVMVTL